MKVKSLVLIMGVIIAIVLIAATWRITPLTSAVYRGTALTTEQTTITLPGSKNAVETIISNDGTGTLYIKFSAGTINTQTDFYLAAGESIQNINIPWRTLELKAASSSAAYRILVSY